MYSLRVLIVEDDTVSATLHKAMLESEGHSVVGVARSEDEAITLAMSERPDLVLMDIYLEDGTSGVHAAKIMYSSYALPVIFITCGTAVDQLQEVVDSDAFALIKKPVSLEELRVNLSIVMRRAAEIQENREQSARYETLVDMLPVAVFSVVEGGRIDWCNAACADALAYASPKDFCEQCSDVDSLLVGADESLLLLEAEKRVARKLLSKDGKVLSRTLYKIEHCSSNPKAGCLFFVLE